MNYKKYIQKNKIDVTKRDTVFELSNLITEARLFAGFSQAELAKRMRTQQPSIARAENGELEPSISFLQKVADAVKTKLILPKFGFAQDIQGTTLYVSPIQVSEKYLTPKIFETSTPAVINENFVNEK